MYYFPLGRQKYQGIRKGSFYMKEKKLINDGWYFIKNAKEAPSTIASDADLITLPHTWNADDGTDGGNDYFRGSCLYMRRLVLSDIASAEAL